MNPESKVRDFLKAWKDKKWKKMVNVCQITWLSNQNDARQLLRDQFGNFNLIQYKIKEEIITTNEVMAHVPIIMTIRNLLGKVEQKYCICVVIKEEGPYQTNVEGTWGVNPISMLRRVDASSKAD